MTRNESSDVSARYVENGGEVVLTFEHEGESATIVREVEGEKLFRVLPTPDDDVLARYFSLEMALDHVADLLGVPVDSLSLPDEADLEEA